MDFSFIDLFLHLDTYLESVVQQYSAATYAILFVIIFFETGIVVTPFLPGDSLLFAAGAIAAIGKLNGILLFIILCSAAITGDTVNYHIGKAMGPRIFKKEDSFFFKKENLLRAQTFYEKYGKKTIILARFIPIIRTFAPFVAGIGSMTYATFLVYNAVGALLWCGLFIFAGYLFGNIPWVAAHFSGVILIIIAISLIPLLKELIVYLRHK